MLVRRAHEADEEARVAEVALRLPLGGLHLRLERRLDVSGDFAVDLGDTAEVLRLHAPVVVVLDQFDETHLVRLSEVLGSERGLSPSRVRRAGVPGAHALVYEVRRRAWVAVPAAIEHYD